MKIVFMGTPDFSVEPLKELVKAGHDVSLVLTREDKKRNRGELSPTPVKELALSLNGGELPMGCHRWNKESRPFWSRFIDYGT